MRILRQAEKEKDFFDQLSGTGFGLKRAPLPSKPGLFRLRARTHPVDFLLNSLPRLAQAGYEIFGEEKLKTARVNRNTPTISFRVSSGIDWFDVQAVVNFGDLEVPMQDIRRLLRKRERYIKLPDGSIGEIPEVLAGTLPQSVQHGRSTGSGTAFFSPPPGLDRPGAQRGGQPEPGPGI